MIFNNNDDLKKFAKLLIEKLEVIDETVLANELKKWDETFFTTSSEFLGELKMILERIRDLTTLDNATKDAVKDCITVINKAFGQ